MTYVVTAFQMALNVVTSTGADFGSAIVEFLSVFAVTQIPLAIVEGIILAMFAQYLSTARPELFGIADENKINPFTTEV
jgi:cobalt/nickel transport system permease protein